MTERPHDITDLYLAPVALAVDARIAELSELADEELAVHVGLASDKPDWSTEFRREAVLKTLSHLIEMHGWTVSWDERGIRLSHGNHSLVLGAPTNLARYVAGVPAGTAS
jgi:hypothetical protein